MLAMDAHVSVLAAYLCCPNFGACTLREVSALHLLEGMNLENENAKKRGGKERRGTERGIECREKGGGVGGEYCAY